MNQGASKRGDEKKQGEPEEQHRPWCDCPEQRDQDQGSCNGGDQSDRRLIIEDRDLPRPQSILEIWRRCGNLVATIGSA